MPPATHPVWSILKTAVLLGGFAVILYLNASNFDHTEMKTLMEAMLLMAGVEAFHARQTSKSEQK